MRIVPHLAKLISHGCIAGYLQQPVIVHRGTLFLPNMFMMFHQPRILKAFPQSYSDNLKCSHNTIILPEAVLEIPVGGVPE